MMFAKVSVVAFVTLFSMGNAQDAKVSKEGEVCGGMMRPAHTCQKPLECVNTKGPMIADAPGTCKTKCPTTRDAWGNCVPKNCEIWSDGCNTCHFKNNKLTGCSEKLCYDVKHEAKCETYSTTESEFFHCSKYLDELSKINPVCCAGEKGGTCLNGFPSTCSPECASIMNLLFNNCDDLLKVTGLEKEKGWSTFSGKCKKTSGGHGNVKIPDNCATWYDGCNTCSVTDGKVKFCTRRACLRLGTPACRGYHNGQGTQREHGRQCFDGKDNDHDGKSDCEDSDCQIYGRCRRAGGHETGRMCFDHKDNDHDGKADCDDSDCQKDPRARWHCRRTEKGRQCFDGIDNDHDGKSDCDDSDCQRYGKCRRVGGKETGRMCFDHKDNDHDGKTDCDDSDCLKDPRALWRCKRTETGRECFDGKDNDKDGKTDCDDSDCLRDPLVRQRCHNRRNEDRMDRMDDRVRN
jgi:hypothetical protein